MTSFVAYACCVTFAMKMREHRERLGMSQAQLGRLVGLGRTSITNIEAGRQPVSLATACRIAEALDTTLSLLVGEAVMA